MALLFTIGLSGIFYFFNDFQRYSPQSYFDTEEFQYEAVDEYLTYLNLFELSGLTKEQAKRSITVTTDEINEHRYRYGNLAEQLQSIHLQYEDRIEEAKQLENKEVAEAYIQERDAKIEDITNNFKSDDSVRAKVKAEKEAIIEEHFNERNRMKEDYSRFNEFQYYFTDVKTGKVYTNVTLEKDQTIEDVFQKQYMHYLTNTMRTSNYETINYYNDYTHYDWLVTLLSDASKQLRGQIAVPKTLSPTSEWWLQSESYNNQRLLFIGYNATAGIAFLLWLLLMRKMKVLPAEMVRWKFYYNKLPIDVRAVFFGLTVIAAIFSIFMLHDSLRFAAFNPFAEYGTLSANAMDYLFILFIATLLWLLTYAQGRFILIDLRERDNVAKEWKRGLLYKGWNRLKLMFRNVLQSLQEVFLNQTTGIQLFLVLGLVFGLGLAGIMMFMHPVFFLFYLILLGFVGLPVLMILIRHIGYFNKIVLKASDMAVGKLGDNLEVKGNSTLSNLASNLNALKQGVKTSQSEQAKSERLKTELITNVSHDLRTPLTSIITYTELLKASDLSHEDKSAYLEIIDRKSQRLKVLIDDLFEVSKMTSGNIELNKAKVDLVQLIQQALAEHDSSLKDCNLQFRVTSSEQPINSFVDGQKLWRVFDNLIGNIVKYSLEHSRVYISAQTLDKQAILTFKNISKYELNDSSEELFERFKRGDTSRHTDGSGLGLAIAKSIIDLHEGSLEIDTDGDLFKVTIKLELVE